MGRILASGCAATGLVVGQDHLAHGGDQIVRIVQVVKLLLIIVWQSHVQVVKLLLIIVWQSHVQVVKLLLIIVWQSHIRILQKNGIK